MVRTIRIIFLVGKINIPLPRSKEGHECGVISMVEPKREQFERFIYILGSRHNGCLNSIMIDVKTPEDILSYLNSCVKQEIHI